MTTNKEALEKIFEAALKEAETPVLTPRSSGRPKQATFVNPRTNAAVNAVLATPPPRRPIKQANTDVEIPMDRPKRTKKFKTSTTSSTVAGGSSPVIDDAASGEFDAPLETKSGKRGKWVLVALVLLVIGVGIGWLFLNPEPAESINSASKDVISTEASPIAD